MNKKLFGAMAVAIALFAGYNMYESSTEMKLSDLALANIEALANGESENSGKKCYKITEKVENETDLGVNVIDCDDCSQYIKVSFSSLDSKCK